MTGGMHPQQLHSDGSCYKASAAMQTKSTPWCWTRDHIYVEQDMLGMTHPKLCSRR